MIWPSARSTFDGYHGEDTLIGRAAARWDSRGSVRVERGLGRSDATVDTVRRFRLDPDGRVATTPAPHPAELRGPFDRRRFRVAGPEAAAQEGERVVERVRDGWGREWAVVLGRAVRGS